MVCPWANLWVLGSSRVAKVYPSANLWAVPWASNSDSVCLLCQAFPVAVFDVLGVYSPVYLSYGAELRPAVAVEPVVLEPTDSAESLVQGLPSHPWEV